MKTSPKKLIYLNPRDERKEAVLEYVTAAAQRGIIPSVREIGSALDIPSTSTVYSYLKKLEAEGLITALKSGKRTVGLLNKSPTFKVFPVIAGTDCSGDFFASQKILFTLPFDKSEITNEGSSPEELSDGDCFGLFQPDSGLGAFGIKRGDLLICIKTNEANNGDLIVYVDGNRLLTGCFTTTNGSFLITTDSTETSCDSVTVKGRIAGLRRKISVRNKDKR